MGALRALFHAGFRHQASFRFAMVSGLITNVFFGFVRTGVFVAVYREHEQVGGLALADALTYVWILQAVFAVVWTPWIQELPSRIRSGEWTAELTRPGSILARHFSYESGRAAATLLLRAPLPLALAAVVFDLRLPTDPARIAAFVLSLVLAALMATCLRFLIGSIAFWSPDFRGIYSLAFGPLWLLSGFVIPMEYFPDALRLPAMFGPLGAVLRAPVAVAGGRDVLTAVALQCGWLALFVLACHLVTERATRRMVVFGG